jgi:hypothetical protein
MKSSFTCAAAPLQFQTISFVSHAPERGFDLTKIPNQLHRSKLRSMNTSISDATVEHLSRGLIVSDEASLEECTRINLFKSKRIWYELTSSIGTRAISGRSTRTPFLINRQHLPGYSRSRTHVQVCVWDGVLVGCCFTSETSVPGPGIPSRDHVDRQFLRDGRAGLIVGLAVKQARGVDVRGHGELHDHGLRAGLRRPTEDVTV